MTTSSIARYLRIGETFERPAAPSQIAPGEMGETGGAVARYLKIERYERPVVKARPAPKQARPASKPKARKERHLRVHHSAKAQRPEPHRPAAKKAAMVQCPDCDAMVSPSWGQCPNCALLLDFAA